MKAMNLKQIFMIVAIFTALSVAMIATPVMAQNMSGGNATGGNMTNSSGSISSVLDDLDVLESSTFESNKGGDGDGGSINIED